ncbi:MAG: hypothetical protein DBX47_05955 [Clostridiales bacterium]|nr:MAG: hypothetical protein DBX47_05955 [Clostridiales bacterium]
MKKLTLVFSLTFLFILASVFSSNAQTSEFTMQAGYTYAGNSVRLDILYSDAQPLTSANLTLSYDAAMFSYASVSGATANDSSGDVTLNFSGNTLSNVCSVVFNVSDKAYVGSYKFNLYVKSALAGQEAVTAENIVKYVDIIGSQIKNDTNLDGKVSTTDARYILQAVVGNRILTGAEQTNALFETDKLSTSLARKVLESSLSDKGIVTDIEICVPPIKTEYKINENLSVEGGKIFATYSEGIKEMVDLSATTVSGFSSTSRGQKNINVVYGDKKTSFYAVVDGTTFSNSAQTYSNGLNFNYLCGVDMYGRTFEPVSGFDNNKDVGIFYFLATGPHIPSGQTQIYDITQLIAEGKEEDVLYSPYAFGMTFFWGKPVFGYYRSGEPWVVNRHIEMLSSAGIDYILFDVTNAIVYQDSYFTVLKALRKYKDEGWNVPKIGFYTHFYSSSTMTEVYNTLYSNSLYTAKYGDLYYAPNGKPLIIGDNPTAEVAANMDVRPSYWPQQGEWGTLDDYGYQGFPWIEWVFEPYMHADKTICVSVAQHRNGGFSFAPITPHTALPRTGNNWGRGTDAAGNRNEDSYGLGQNFQRQWDIALEKGATTVFMTGWNEWTVTKDNSVDAGGVIYFCDQYNPEFSRDIEPVTGGFEDSFYLQMISNIRRYKGEYGNMSQTVKKTIDVNNISDFTQWNDVTNNYRNVQFYSYNRYATPVAGSLLPEDKSLYRAAAPVNNITGVKITNDSKNIYFLITTSANAVGNGSSALTSSDRWMNVFLSVGSLKAQGWEGYKYVVNRTATTLNSGMTGTGSINLLNADGTTGVKVGTATISMSGKNIQIAVPLSAIGATGSETGFYFKIADNITDYLDICNYYVTGKSFPMGRLSYYYYF